MFAEGPKIIVTPLVTDIVRRAPCAALRGAMSGVNVAVHPVRHR